LGDVGAEVLHEVLIQPESGQDFVKLTQMFVVGVVLEDIELDQVTLDQLLHYGQLAEHLAAGCSVHKHIEHFKGCLNHSFIVL
jgi:hypothetical protein